MPSNDSPVVLVTGLSGLVGTELSALARPGCQWRPPGESCRVDVTDGAALEAALDASPGASAVLHLAAFTDTQAAFEQTGDRERFCYRVNVAGTRNVARACRRRGLHLIYVSTDYVFRGDRDEPWTEDDEPDPIDWYGRTKWLGEGEAREASAWTIARLAFPYGPHSSHLELCGKLKAAWRRNGRLSLFSDQFITPTWLGDIAAGLALLCRTRPAGEIFHLTGSEWTTPYDFGRAAAPVLEIPPAAIEPSRLAEFVSADGRPRHRSLRMDNSKWKAFAERHGLAAPADVAEGLRRSEERMKNEGQAKG